MSRLPPTAGSHGPHGDQASQYRASLGPGPFEEPRFGQRPVGSQRHAVLHRHPAKDAKRFAAWEPSLNVLRIAVPEPLIGERPHDAVGPPPVHTIADRYGPLPV